MLLFIQLYEVALSLSYWAVRSQCSLCYNTLKSEMRMFSSFHLLGVKELRFSRPSAPFNSMLTLNFKMTFLLPPIKTTKWSEICPSLRMTMTLLSHWDECLHYLKRSLHWLTAVKTTMVGWLFSFRVHVIWRCRNTVWTTWTISESSLFNSSLWEKMPFPVFVSLFTASETKAANGVSSRRLAQQIHRPSYN